MSTTANTTESILNGTTALPSGADLKSLVSALKKEFNFGLARELLNRENSAEPSDVWIVQQLALCTYKDEELQPDDRFRTALSLLDSIGLRDKDAKIDPDTRPETLGLGGAIYKRKWEHNGQLENLHESLFFYRAAWQFNRQKDMGYGGVNAAYVLDILESRARMSRDTHLYR